MINVLIADDSAVVREFISYILLQDQEISVVGFANNGEEAVRLVSILKPDIVVMDIEMPKMNGFEATRKIMETTPLPIVIITSVWDKSQVEKTFKAMEAGALVIMEKPKGIGSDDYPQTAENLVQTVKTMSEVRVVRRISRANKPKADIINKSPENLIKKRTSVELVVIGASTGGPMALKTILSALPADFVPVVIVQHITRGFTRGLVDWLNLTTKMNVQIAEQNQEISRGNIYIAPDDFQMKLIENKIILTDDGLEHSVKPAVSYLFRSVARYFSGRAVGVILTGMGKDGAQELKLMRDSGCTTIAQDKESSVVYGMPGEAEKLGAADYILHLDTITNRLINLIGRGNV